MLRHPHLQQASGQLLGQMMNEPDVVAEVDRQGARQVIEDVMKAAHERQRMQEQRHMHQQQVLTICNLTPRLFYKHLLSSKFY